jgi:hypothetical protein
MLLPSSMTYLSSRTGRKPQISYMLATNSVRDVCFIDAM